MREVLPKVPSGAEAPLVPERPLASVVPGRQQLIEPGAVPAFDARVHTVHLWHELWRREGQDKDGCYPRGCLYEQLKRRYCLD